MNDRSPLRRFLKISRDFGFVIAIKVAYSKLRGSLFPALALPDAPVYNASHRQLSVLLSTTEQNAPTLEAIVEVLAERGGWDWEICVCERAPVEPEMARAIAHFRGTQPWIRIVTAGESVDDATAAQWTVEQATGQLVALVAREYAPDAGTIARLVARLQNDSTIDAVILVGMVDGSATPRSPVPWADCRMLLQRKSEFLALGRWLLTAPALAKDLERRGALIACMPGPESEAPD